MSKRIVVLGGGPGGYVAALRAAKLGGEVIVVEKAHLGGVCLNEGCIPTKTFHKHASVVKDIKRADKFGINIEGFSIDYAKMVARKDSVVLKLRKGIEFLLKNAKIKVINGVGEITSKNEVIVTKADGTKETVACDNIIIATGAAPAKPPIKGIDLTINSREFLELTEMPKSLAVIGGGVIGIEVASILSTLGSEVSVFEMQKEILPGMDEGLASALKKELEKKGIKIYTSCAVSEIAEKDGGLAVKFEDKEQIFDKVLCATGRIPTLPESKIEFAKNRAAIKVDEYLETSVKGIYCIGDANGVYQLAHVASAEGVVAAENIFGANKKMNYKTVPSVVYSFPEVASVGALEKDAANCKKGTYNYMACGKAVAMDETSGFVKVLADEKYGEILGVHMIGYDASNIIGEAGLALSLESTVAEVAGTIHAHPSLSEVLFEACKEMAEEN